MNADAMNSTSLLSAQHIRITRQGRDVLSDVSLTLPSRGSIALVGPNGAGKSTLLNVLAGQITPDSGDVQWRKQPLHSLSVKERARGIGYMPQRFEPHWDVTLAELMDMRLQGQRDVDHTLAAAGLTGFAARRWSTLSGGEQARALLATVLATDPPALLADEPGAALDVQHRLALVESLAARGREQLVVVVMHDLDLAFAEFDRVVVMHQGCIVMDGAPAELLHQPQLDDVFGVDFDRISVPPSTLLRARRRGAVNDDGGLKA